MLLYTVTARIHHAIKNIDCKIIFIKQKGFCMNVYMKVLTWFQIETPLKYVRLILLVPECISNLFCDFFYKHDVLFRPVLLKYGSLYTVY